jgi:hypothetical protein
MQLAAPGLISLQISWCKQHRTRPRKKRESGAPTVSERERKNLKGWATRLRVTANALGGIRIHFWILADYRKNYSRVELSHYAAKTH